MPVHRPIRMAWHSCFVNRTDGDCWNTGKGSWSAVRIANHLFCAIHSPVVVFDIAKNLVCQEVVVDFKRLTVSVNVKSIRV